MGILRAMAIRRRVKEMQEYARVLSVATAELRYRRDILAQVFVRVAKNAASHMPRGCQSFHRHSWRRSRDRHILIRKWLPILIRSG